MKDMHKSLTLTFFLVTSRFLLVAKGAWYAIPVALTFILAVPAYSTPLSVNDAAKTSQQIIEKAQRGVPQSLIVEFDHKNITDMINKKRLVAGAMFDREEDTAEKRREYASLRERIFPNGRLGDAHVTTQFENLPFAVVDVPNSQALEQILSHPLVTVVSENVTAPPIPLYYSETGK